MNKIGSTNRRQMKMGGSQKMIMDPRKESIAVSGIRRFQGANTIAMYALLKLFTIKLSFSFQYPEIGL